MPAHVCEECFSCAGNHAGDVVVSGGTESLLQQRVSSRDSWIRILGDEPPAERVFSPLKERRSADATLPARISNSDRQIGRCVVRIPASGEEFIRAAAAQLAAEGMEGRCVFGAFGGVRDLNYDAC